MGDFHVSIDLAILSSRSCELLLTKAWQLSDGKPHITLSSITCVWVAYPIINWVILDTYQAPSVTNYTVASHQDIFCNSLFKYFNFENIL